jgi:hypothetical protein
MKLNIRNKRFIIFFVVLVLILVAGGAFWKIRKYYDKNNIEKIMKMISNYTLEYTSEGKILKSKDEYISFKIPSDWTLKTEDKYLSSPIILSPDLFKNYKDGKEKNIFNSQEGCLIICGVDNESSNLEDLKESIKKGTDLAGLSLETKFENTKVGNYDAIRSELVNTTFGYSNGLFISINNKIYGFEIYSGEKYYEKCSKEFDDFLSTISIKK